MDINSAGEICGNVVVVKKIGRGERRADGDQHGEKQSAKPCNEYIASCELREGAYLTGRRSGGLPLLQWSGAANMNS